MCSSFSPSFSRFDFFTFYSQSPRSRTSTLSIQVKLISNVLSFVGRVSFFWTAQKHQGVRKITRLNLQQPPSCNSFLLNLLFVTFAYIPRSGLMGSGCGCGAGCAMTFESICIPPPQAGVFLKEAKEQQTSNQYLIATTQPIGRGFLPLTLKCLEYCTKMMIFVVPAVRSSFRFWALEDLKTRVSSRFPNINLIHTSGMFWTTPPGFLKKAIGHLTEFHPVLNDEIQRPSVSPGRNEGIHICFELTQIIWCDSNNLKCGNFCPAQRSPKKVCQNTNECQMKKNKGQKLPNPKIQTFWISEDDLTQSPAFPISFLKMVDNFQIQQISFNFSKPGDPDFQCPQRNPKAFCTNNSVTQVSGVAFPVLPETLLKIPVLGGPLGQNYTQFSGQQQFLQSLGFLPAFFAPLWRVASASKIGDKLENLKNSKIVCWLFFRTDKVKIVSGEMFPHVCARLPLQPSGRAGVISPWNSKPR